jgi:TolB-like protein
MAMQATSGQAGALGWAKTLAPGVGKVATRQKLRPIVRIHLLGPMRASTCLGADALPRSRKARALLGYLCLCAGEPVSRARLAALLWDRVPAAQARINLRRALAELKAAWGRLAGELIGASRLTVRLNAGACWIDALAASTPASGRNAPGSELAALCRGELLEELDNTSASFDRWLQHQRMRFTQRMRALAGERGGTVSATQQPSAPPPSASSGRLRVGILPFSADDRVKKANLAFSFSQEIAAGLGRFRWFDVIAPGSVRRARSGSFSRAQQQERRDLDYLVDGAVSGGGESFKVDVRLLAVAGQMQPVWSDRIDLAVSDLHRLDELVTERIAARIDPVILHIEGPRQRRERYGATGLLLLAIPMIFSMERKKYEAAGRLIADALRLEPDNAMVEAWAAHWHLFYIGQGWARDREAVTAAVERHARRAITLDPENAEGLGIYAHMCSIVHKDFDAARYYFDRSLRLNPSMPFIWALSAMTYCYIGEPDMALVRLERSREVAPIDPYFSWFESFYTVAYTFKGDYERAVLVGRRAVKANRNFVPGYQPLIASLGHLGRRAEARPYVRKLLSLDPSFTVERFLQVYPIKKATDRARYGRGLRLAGVPER